MYGGEAEHDGRVRASTTMSVAYSCTTVAFREKGADRRSGIMYGGEAEHDRCVRSSATMSVACSCTTVAIPEKRAKEESLESAKPGFIGDRKEVWSCSVVSEQLCTTIVGMSQLQIGDTESDVSFKERCFLLGDVCQLKVTASGIDTPLQTTPQRQHYEDHYCAHLKAPKGVVNPGVELGMRYAVILEGPFSFPNGYRRVSSVLFLCCNNPQQLQKELTIQLRHWANVTDKGSGLCFMKANHELGRGESCYSFTPMEGGDFDQDSGRLRLSHFCFLCAAIHDSKGYSSNRFYAVLSSKRDQEFRICIAYAIPSWLTAIKEHYWKDKGDTSNFVLPPQVFTWQSEDAALSLEALTLTAPGCSKLWRCTVLQQKVHFKKLAIDKNLKRLHEHCTEEMNNGLYPPSLQFKITYAYGMEDNHKRTPHTVSVTGCDEEDEVKFVVDVFEPPDTPDIQPPTKSVSKECTPVEEETHNNMDAVKQRLATPAVKTMTHRGIEMDSLPTPHPISPGENDRDGVTIIQRHKHSNSYGVTEQDELTLPTAVAESGNGSSMCPMKEWNRNALDALRGELKENVIMEHGLNDRLVTVAGGFMSGAEAQAVLSKTSNAKQMGKLISILLGKSDADFGKFCAMLRAVEYEVWANELEKNAEMFKQTPGLVVTSRSPKKTSWVSLTSLEHFESIKIASSYTPSAVPPPSHSEVHSHGLLQRAETCQATLHARGPRVKNRQNHGYTAPASM